MYHYPLPNCLLMLLLFHQLPHHYDYLSLLKTYLHWHYLLTQLH
ncbi:hypothetical protein ECP03052603_4945 [Escherichia coli P0305260.3]|nr:hypothetical protein ECP03052603_4945 [Escherichia coli P0305260.3]